MDRDYVFQLTLGLYRVTDLFSEREPLKFKIREKAGDILACLAKANFDPRNAKKAEIDTDLNILYTYLDLAQSQEWIDKRNFFVIKQGYDNIREAVAQNRARQSPLQDKPSDDQTISAMVSVKNRLPPISKHKENSVNDAYPRKTEIRKVLQHKGPMRLVQLLEFFPAINKRTLRRDLTALVGNNELQRYDVGKLTFYKVKSI